MGHIHTCHLSMTLLPSTLCRWVFVYEKGYQSSSGLISSVSVKLKGLAMTQFPGLGPQVWDVADYVFPAQVSLLRCIPSTDRAWLRIGLGSIPPRCGISSAPISLWASVSLTVSEREKQLINIPHSDVMGYRVSCGVCLGSQGCSPSSEPCPLLPGRQLLCGHDKFYCDPPASSRLLCRGKDCCPCPLL